MRRLALFISLLILVPNSWGAVSLVTHTAKQSTDTNPIITSAINTSGCNSHCMEAACYSATSSGVPANPVSDSLSNSWVKVRGQFEDGDVYVALYVSFAPTVGASQTFTASGFGPSIAVMAFNGVASGPDQVASNEIGFGSSLAIGSITPTNADEVLIPCFGENGGDAGITYSITSGFTIVDQIAEMSSNVVAISSAYQVQTTATARNATWSCSGCTMAASAVIGSFYSTDAPATLAVTTAALPEGFNGTPYSYTLQASGGISPYTWTKTAGTYPTGLGLSSGILSGTPTQTISATPLTFQVQDSASTTASSGSLPLTIAASALSITTTTCASGTQLTSYSGCTISATGGTTPLTFSTAGVGSGFATLPAGMALNASTGAISSANVGGQGTYIAQLIVTDSLNATASQTITFAVQGNNSYAPSIFPSNSIFHHRMDAATTGLPVDSSPAAPINSAYLSSALRVFFGSAASGNTPNGIPIISVPSTQSNVTVTTEMSGCFQSYFTSGPIPGYAPIEGTQNLSDPTMDLGDGHVLVYQQAGGGNPPKLWELWQGQQVAPNWLDCSNATWPDVSGNNLTTQGMGTTDAAGLPVAPLLLNADEVIGSGTPSSPSGSVQHPTRVTVNHILNYWVWPSTQTSGIGSCDSIPTFTQISQSSPPTTCSWSGPAGEIYRLKAATVTPTCASTSPQAAIIITGFRNYGIILADNGLTGGTIGTPDTRWNDTDLACLTQLHLSDFEPVNVSSLIIGNDSGQTPSAQPPTPISAPSTSLFAKLSSTY